MDEMQSALQELFEKNETMAEECERLREANSRLTEENAELLSRLSAPCNCANANWISGVPPSAERNDHTFSSGSGSGQFAGATEGAFADGADLPSLPDLLDQFDVDESLEELAQSLLQDIARDLEEAANRQNQEEPVSDKQRNNREMVGSPSEKLESCGSALEDVSSDDDDISKYLLLHHNYSLKPKKNAPKKSTKPKYKKIVPKVEQPHLQVITMDPAKVTATLTDDNEVVYYAFDEITNSLTVFSAEDAEVEVVNCEEADVSSAASDYGYESHGSPDHISEVEDIWDKSISELFPTLA
ncbi:unnamed protein product [Brassicogethes aeneus]|uniref:Uncharacterized protein n=1 Tax=Brassicogethes aeneus TaxID=1431903 RepID=A0A9P0B7W6_BRAAE|nr:unnamed protein product [Brassicogethes aeneus]